MFEKASRLKLRFDTPVGQLSTEDLWDLPLKNANGRASLNLLAQSLSAKVKASEQEDFVDDAAGADETVALAFDIVKHVIAEKKADRDRKAEAADRAEKKRRLLALIGQKQDEALSAKSVDELRAELAAL